MVDPQAASDVRALVEELAALGFHVLEARHGRRAPRAPSRRRARPPRRAVGRGDALADQLERRRAGGFPGRAGAGLGGRDPRHRGRAGAEHGPDARRRPGSGRAACRSVGTSTRSCSRRGSTTARARNSGCSSARPGTCWPLGMPTETCSGESSICVRGSSCTRPGRRGPLLFSSLARPGTAAIVAAGVDAAERDDVSTAAADVGGVVMAARDRPTASGGLEGSDRGLRGRPGARPHGRGGQSLARRRGRARAVARRAPAAWAARWEAPTSASTATTSCSAPSGSRSST